MASPSVLLALCSGPTVMMWDCRSTDIDEIPKFQPHDAFPVADISWNHHGQVLASCSAMDIPTNVHDNIVLTSVSTRTRLNAFVHDPGLEQRGGSASPVATTSIAFGTKYRYLCLGDSGGTASLWDLKKQTRARAFCVASGPCLQACLNPTETHMMALSEEALHLYRLREGHIVASLAPEGSGLYHNTVFCSSSLQPYNAAVGTREGDVQIWDTLQPTSAASQPLLSLNKRHSDSVTGVAFSAVHRVLLASTSLDGALSFFDTSSKNEIQSLEIGQAATCLSFHSDGFTCAVGTGMGKVRAYDLRRTSSHLASLQVGSDSITSVQFAPPGATMEQAAAAQQRPADVASITGASPTRPMVSNKAVLSSNGGPAPTDSVDEQRGAMSSAPVNPTNSLPNASSQEVATHQGSLVSAATNGHASSTESIQAVVNESVNTAVDALRDEIVIAIRNLHVDMLRQSLKQREEFSKILAQQTAITERLLQDNAALRDENERLKQMM